MRKVDPTSICNDFDTEVSGLGAFLGDVAGGLDDRGAHDPRLGILCELVFHRGYVAFESFISALIIGCVNKDARPFLQYEAHRVDESIATKFSDAHAARTHFQVVKHLSVQEIDALLTSEGKNITFTTAEQMVSKAKQWLPSQYSSKFGKLSKNQLLAIDLSRLIRNCIAHQSHRSFDEMNKALRALPNVALLWNFRRGSNKVHDVGSYLKTSIAGRSRTELFLEQFRNIAGSLK